MTLETVHTYAGTRRAVAVVVAVLALGCGKTITEEPHTPTSSSGSTLTPVNPIPAAPAPQPTPTPVPTPTPDFPPPAGGGGGGGGGSGSCPPPTPPPLGRIQVGLLIVGSGRLILDSTPLVGPSAEYCQQIGYTDGRRYCPVRPEGNPDRATCEAGLVGRAADTGRIGPTWKANGAPCSDGGGSPSCQNHPDNQYLVYAYGSGTFEACAQNGMCGAYVVP